jgi:hypothetical protein
MSEGEHSSGARTVRNTVPERLRQSAQQALWGRVPPSLCAVSVAATENQIHFRCYFDAGAPENERQVLSEAATEIIGDFSAPWTISEEFLDLAAPEPMRHLEHLIFLRDEQATRVIYQVMERTVTGRNARSL